MLAVRLMVGGIVIAALLGSPLAGTAADPPAADVSLRMVDDPDPVVEGHQVTYTLTASNAGPDAASDVTVRDDLPPA